MREAGGYFMPGGRLKDRVSAGGENVYSAEVEAARVVPVVARLVRVCRQRRCRQMRRVPCIGSTGERGIDASYVIVFDEYVFG